MPNHVYNVITVEEKYAEKLAEIAKVGLCRYYKPMPEELVGTTSPQIIDETISNEEHERLTDKYGTADWYTWANREWGTKWGAYDGEYEDGRYSFLTAWAPPSQSIIYMLAQDIPDFDFLWEEEQGFGEEMSFKRGNMVSHFDWDIPEWEYIEDADDIVLLKEDYENHMGKYRKGYYHSYDLEGGYLGDTLEEAKDELNSIKS